MLSGGNPVVERLHRGGIDRRGNGKTASREARFRSNSAHLLADVIAEVFCRRCIHFLRAIRCFWGGRISYFSRL